MTDLSFLQAACKGFVGVFHHAALASVADSADLVRSQSLVNAPGTLNVLMSNGFRYQF